MARTSTPLDDVDRMDGEAEARQSLYEEAERVMATSKPTPTQRENDLYKVGAMHPDDKEDPVNPEMPSVADQQKRIAAAGSSSQMSPQPQPQPPAPVQRRSVEAATGAPYMTRDAMPRHTPAAQPSSQSSS